MSDKVLKIASWNVHGLGNKLGIQDFVNKLSEFDICFLSETWICKNISIPNKYVYSKNATKKGNTHGRKSGGLAIIIDENLRKGVKIIKTTAYGVWKLSKNSIRIQQNVYICALYIPPMNSPYALEQPFELLERDIAEMCEEGEVLIMGDTNGRTGSKKDYIEYGKNDHCITQNHYIANQTSIPLSERFNEDNECNSLGKQLIELCKNCQMYIVNGRTRGDIPGKCTCIQGKGCSTVDYAIASITLKDKIKYFNVTPPDGFSDHSLTKLGMKLPGMQNVEKLNIKLQPLPPKYVWNKDSKDKLLDVLNGNVIKNKIKKVMENKYSNTNEGIEDLCSDVTRIYQNAADFGLSKKISHQNRKKVRNSKYSWEENKTYQMLKESLNALGKLLQKYPRDPYIRGKYISGKKNFRRTIKKARMEQREQILDKIKVMEDQNPTAFWNLVNNIKGKKESHENIEPEIFYDYFRTLHSPVENKKFDAKFATFVKQEIMSNTNNVWVEILDNSISPQEIHDVAKSLKNKKACGYDSITNEIIKCSINVMVPTLLKIFNQILHSEIFPKQWSEGLIVPLYKAGDCLEPSNYRGITIAACLGKLFTKILNNRLSNFLLENKTLVKNQIGFTPKQRPSDHMLVLKTIIDCFKRKCKSLYICFVDLKKAFDTVFREGLIYKLQRLNLSSKFIHILSQICIEMLLQELEQKMDSLIHFL
jgi:hypothetical protein